MIPEIHNIIARWNKEVGVKNTGIKIKDIKDNKFKFKKVIVSIFTDNPDRLIGKQGCIINKYKEEIADFFCEGHHKSTVSVEIELIELNEIVGEEEIDVDKYYKDLVEHAFGDIYEEIIIRSKV